MESQSDILICIRDISVLLTLRLLSAAAFMPLMNRFLANIIVRINPIANEASVTIECQQRGLKSSTVSSGPKLRTMKFRQCAVCI